MGDIKLLHDSNCKSISEAVSKRCSIFNERLQPFHSCIVHRNAKRFCCVNLIRAAPCTAANWDKNYICAQSV